MFLFSEIYAQDPFKAQIAKLKSEYIPPEITKEQMYEDFDYFVDIIKSCNPQYPVVKVITGYDMLENLSLLRKQITDISGVYEFMKIMKTAMGYILDGHCWIGDALWWHRYGLYKDEVKLLGLTDLDFAYMFHYRDSVFYKYPPRIDLCYTDGKYCLKYTTTFYLQNDSMVVPAGSEILLYNNQPIQEHINTFKTNNSAWDNVHKIFYSKRIDIEDNKKTKLKFLIQQEPVYVEFSYFRQDERIFDMEKFRKIHMCYFQKDSVLYIRLPLMSADTLEMKENILSFKNHHIKGVIIDIRENYGGNDKIWEYLLSLIGGTAVRFHSSIIINDHPEVIKRYSGYEIKRSWPMLKTDKPFIVLDDEQAVIENTKENLGYEGLIYILTDDEIFSSAGSFASLGKQNTRIKTVGIHTGVYNGRGATPNGFVLPNSRLPFRLNLTLDDANISEAIDFLHDYITYPVSPTANYFKYYHNPQRSYEVDEKAMYQHDEIFLKTIKLIKE